MRIGTLNMFRQGVDAILERQTDLFRTQQQLSSGKRINRPSDDPSGAAQLVGLSDSLDVTRQYQRNINAIRSRLELEDVSLASIGDALQRVRELTVQGLNDSNGAEARSAMALEVRQILDEIRGLANRTDAAGEYLFSGFQGQTAPFLDDGVGNFSYVGDQGQRLIQVGSSRQIADGNSGFDVFMKIPAVGGGYEDVFSTLYNLAADLDANAPNGASVDQLDNAMENLLGFRATAGARLNAVDRQETTNVALIEQLENTRSIIEDVDFAEAASRLNLQSVTLQAAQQAFLRVQDLNLFNFL
ncbi:Flagellar hook-associated protein FlgL [hydrothermal vent metagenome]|uniref:Flagellar hook-associated protein FlgL n=1 Tax=hydrothermal vent metagenome TaxID=652676 RepID=A0A3B0YD93_9ZZZZ